MNKISRIIKATALCIRFPFLYPRNRWTGRPRKNALGKVLYKLDKTSLLRIGVHAELEKEEKRFLNTEYFFDNSVKIDIENKKIILKTKKETIEHSIKKLLWGDDRFEILGITLEFALSGKLLIIVHVIPKNREDKTNYGFIGEEIKIVTNKFKRKLYKMLYWFDDQVLDRLFFLPDHTELDFMPEGWRKAFGIQMCKEIKSVLKKHKGALKNYRIVQIKEKFGGLRWYDNANTKEIQEIIRKYEEISFKTCINCGEPAECISTGWISPYCNKCKIEGKTYVPIIEEDAWDKAYTYYWPKEEKE